MSHRLVGQLSLADSVVSEVGGSVALRRASTAIDWARFGELLSGLHGGRQGRPSYPPLVLFKCLVLQQWYRLSDPGLEEAVGDRLSFRRFVGLGLQDRVPDHSTLCRFRHGLERDGLAERLFGELARQLGEQGLVLKQGTLVDATVVQADAVPLGYGRRQERSDQDAGFTLTRRGYRLGYKAHVAMDEGSRLIRAAVLTPAHHHEADPSIVARLVAGDEREMLADKGYDSRRVRAHLDSVGVGDGILKRRTGKGPLPEESRQRNAALQPRRVAIESLFGLMKRSYGYARVRYRSLARNAVQLQLLCFAINLRRRLVLA